LLVGSDFEREHQLVTKLDKELRSLEIIILIVIQINAVSNTLAASVTSTTAISYIKLLSEAAIKCSVAQQCRDMEVANR
jgi:hypothetical protein